ncbi:GNAT family N-acetyltransferase [Thermoflexibacter ruber]|uniref:Acetyltransferase (GNAT) domain-containing protein n=1 Tax=Thermoflexibacter ruber TaxID=1003 RepID=A0A1I2H9V7_9BACT|nr:GNAT family N-acetyltransferase [Thermoflexibacter ruber]SFF25757.1 Acetyltransferase (GNAT) domain-containing protein [Thermoflexibacter ruber]
MNIALQAIRYHAHYQQIWNEFVNIAQNATFLFHRSFMDYHADRFQDHSVMVFADKELLAIFPANEKDNVIYSHGGLTYGGVAVAPSVESYQNIFQAIFHYYQRKEFEKIFYKEIPFFYQKSKPTEPKFYPLSLSNQTLVHLIRLCQQDMGAVIDLQSPIHLWHGREQAIKKASHAIPPLEIIEDSSFTQFEGFWNELLIPQLKNKYGLSPTHTLSEISLLAARFPQNIKQYNVYQQGEILAGATIFEDRQVAHCQYVASNNLGKELRATDLLFHYLIKEKYKNFCYFSFGISNEHGSNKVNQGLLQWKISWGAEVCKHLHFQIDLS